MRQGGIVSIQGLMILDSNITPIIHFKNLCGSFSCQPEAPLSYDTGSWSLPNVTKRGIEELLTTKKQDLAGVCVHHAISNEIHIHAHFLLVEFHPSNHFPTSFVFSKLSQSLI